MIEGPRPGYDPWQTMETAPKNGKPFLGAKNLSRIGDGSDTFVCIEIPNFGRIGVLRRAAFYIH